jgi:hypothetical protein
MKLLLLLFLLPSWTTTGFTVGPARTRPCTSLSLTPTTEDKQYYVVQQTVSQETEHEDH